MYMGKRKLTLVGSPLLKSICSQHENTKIYCTCCVKENWDTHLSQLEQIVLRLFKKHRQSQMQHLTVRTHIMYLNLLKIFLVRFLE